MYARLSRRIGQYLARSYLVTAPVWPFASLAPQVEGAPSLSTLAVYASIALGLVALPAVAVRLIRPRSRCGLRVASVIAVAIAVFFAFGALRLSVGVLFNARFWSSLVTLTVWGVVFLATVAATARFAGRREFQIALSIGGAVAVLGPLVSLTIGLGSLAGRPDVPGATAIPMSPVRRPDVYVLWVDGYARADTLRTRYGFDNTPFLAAVGDRGMRVIDPAWANYSSTLPSIGSTLAMRDLSEPGVAMDVAVAQDAMGGENDFVATMVGAGYEYVHYASNNLFEGCDAVHHATRCLERPASLTESDRALLAQTPLSPMYLTLVSHLLPEDIARNIVGESNALPYLTAHLPAPSDVGPMLLFAHVITPHPPFVTDAACRLRFIASPDFGGGWGGTKYTDQLQCANRQLLSLIDAIERQSPDAIIVLQSDHGTAALGQSGRNITTWTPQDVEERQSILLAYRLPEECRDAPYRGMSSHNTLRIVLNCLAPGTIPVLPDRILAGNPFERDGLREIPIPVR